MRPACAGSADSRPSTSPEHYGVTANASSDAVHEVAADGFARGADAYAALGALAGLCGSTIHSSPSGYTSTTARFSRAFSAKIEARPGRSAPTNEAPFGYRAGRSAIPSSIAASSRCEARILPGVRVCLLTVAMIRSSRCSHHGPRQARSASPHPQSRDGKSRRAA